MHANGAPGLSDYANRYFSTQQMNNGLTVHLDYNLNPRNKITLTNIVLNSYLAQARTIIDTAILGGNGGRTVPGTGPVSTDYTSITSHQFLENLKLDGKHILSTHFLVDWIGVYSYASKRSPDMADLALNSKIDTVHTTDDIHGPYIFTITPNYFDQISRVWQHNADQDFDGISNLTYKSALPKNGSLELKAGGLYRHKTRSNNQDEYDLQPTTNASGVKQVFFNINYGAMDRYITSAARPTTISTGITYSRISRRDMENSNFLFPRWTSLAAHGWNTQNKGIPLTLFCPPGSTAIEERLYRMCCPASWPRSS